MRIGLYNLEPKIVNTAMMQVSQYHKEQGDSVEIYSPLYHATYDKVSAFSLFDFTPKPYVRDDMIVGGTGFDVASKLPSEIEACDYDWSLYPECDYSIVWFSRGCIRNCPFCVVNRKEGDICPVKPKNLNPNGEYIKIMDNNFFANPNWGESINQLLEWGQPVDMQGFDIRLFNEEQGEALQKLKHHLRFKFAWDNPKQDIDDKIELLLNYIPPSKLMCYTLIGYWSTEDQDLYRVNHLWDKYKIDSFVMPYNKFDKYQLNFARWVNNKVLFRTRTWQEYKDGYTHTKKDYQRLLQKWEKLSVDPKQDLLTHNKKVVDLQLNIDGLILDDSIEDYIKKVETITNNTHGVFWEVLYEEEI